MLVRPRRNRKSVAIRQMVQETYLSASDFVTPFFLIDGLGKKEPIESMPGIYRLSKDLILKEAEALLKKGIWAVILFPVIQSHKKDSTGSYALSQSSSLLSCIQLLKDKLPDLCVITDIALDPYTSHGHDGLINQKGEVLNDETLQLLGEIALLHTQAGSDIVAPSDMMDGRVKHIRLILDKEGYCDASILAYTAKYASSLYSPFRDALSSAPQYGDKKTYQMNPANIREAILEATLDAEEGADILMIKPALLYLDVIQKIKEKIALPIAAYHVSGEYSMIMAAAKMGWIDALKVSYEACLSIKRAGADIIISYSAKDLVNSSLLKH